MILTHALLAAIAAVAAYAWAAAARLHPRLPAAPLAAPLALTLHALALGLALSSTQGQLGLAQAVSLVTLSTAVALAVLGRVAALAPLRFWVWALAATGAVLSAWHQGPAANPVGWRIALHAALSMVAAGLLTLAALQALAVRLLNKWLHSPERLPQALRLPSLEASESSLFSLIGAGFFVLSLALISGLLFVQNLFAQHLAHKTMLSALAWLVFAVLLIGRYGWGWRGRRAARWVWGGYGLLILAYLGSKWVLEAVLGRHW